MNEAPRGMTRQEGFQAGFGMALAGFRHAITLALRRLRIEERNDPVTLSHFRAAYLAMPGTTAEEWEALQHEARVRYWRITNHYTHERRDVAAYTLCEAIAALAFTAVADVEVNGPRSISHAEEDAAWAYNAEMREPYWARFEEEEFAREDAERMDGEG